MSQFNSSWLKIKRANEHIAEVNRRIGIVVDPEHQTTWTKTDPQGGREMIHYRVDKLSDLPGIALVIGDAVHNLKTALDYAWHEVISVFAPTAISKHSKFPVYGSAEELEAALKGWNLPVLAPRLFQFAVHDIKSYQGGDFSIWAVHRLDIMDKHKLLIPTVSYGTIKGLELKDERGQVYPINNLGVEIDGVYRIASARGVTFNQKGGIAIEILFKEAPTKSLEVREGLRIFYSGILSVVKLSEKLIEGC